MNLTEYTDKRADLLSKLNISEFDNPQGIRFLWFDIVTGHNIRNRIHTGIHTHSFFEIQIVFSGNVSYDCDDSNVFANEGYAILIPPNVPHRFLKCDESLLKGSIAFSADLPWFNLGKVDKFRISDVCNDVNFILSKIDDNNIFTSHLVCGRLFEIFCTVCKLLNVSIPSRNKKNLDPRFIVAKRFIETKRNQIINTEDVARECGLSSKQLNRIFRQNTNKSLHEYIVDIRIKTATEMLKNIDLSIKEVGYELGFENESGFTSFFKRHCGVSPGVYRKNQMSDI